MRSCFFWGPRQTGKSTLLRQRFPGAPFYDLLLASEFRRLSANPGLLREECLGVGRESGPVIIDEIQKLPELLDEVHSLISHESFRFILCGSSARKLVRGGGNLLGGRAVRLELFPLTSAEIPDFSLDRALNHGLLPAHYLSDDPGPLLEAYVGEYLKEEVLAESLTRNLPAFQRFLEVASFSNGRTVNFAAIAREVGGISPPGVRGYFEILTDTLVGCWLPAWQKRAKRRVVQSPRFYFFDVGLVNELTHRGKLRPRSVDYGLAFEHLIFMELRAYSGYRKNRLLSYWRTSSGYEVDFVLGDAEVAIEVQSTENPASDHLKGLRAWKTEQKRSRTILVCRAPRRRKTADGIEILPWRAFLTDLWSGDLM